MINNRIHDQVNNRLNNQIICKVVKIIGLSSTTSKITLVPENHKLDFLPGQYIYVFFDNHKKIPYSIYSSPIEDYIELLIFNGNNNENLNYFKKRLGLMIHVSSAIGGAYYRRNNNKIIAIGKGLGISPIKSIIDYLILIKSDVKILLYYISHTEKELVVDSYFNDSIKKNNILNINYYPIIVEEKKHLERLHSSLLLVHNDHDFMKNSDFYVFGSNDFVKNSYRIYQELTKLNVDSSSVFYTDCDLNI